MEFGTESNCGGNEFFNGLLVASSSLICLLIVRRSDSRSHEGDPLDEASENYLGR